ncbi:SGNH/GDSL hydrolase family protein [Seonamhaeicola sp.]|uniref:SGNH/GDSL hydrolase family protein n=1 Tax=Seonamhaeicola sp. TaxID=1912245 RepID=UPI0026114126|nr:SGNH/GDSL hydrolase family protein [Seonamhaeicola sp.]
MDGKTAQQIVQEYTQWSAIKNDWANLAYYQEANSLLQEPAKSENRVVFMGNSITEMWKVHVPTFFENESFINRGISGQTTPQMLIRFRQDVIQLQPRIVVILAGTNDIAGNTGPTTNQMILDNIISMIEMANANNVKVILCSVLPVNKYPWFPNLKPADRVISLNKSLESYAKKHSVQYVDYYSALVDKEKGLPKKYAPDGVHPNKLGYSIMEPLVLDALNN